MLPSDISDPGGPEPVSTDERLHTQFEIAAQPAPMGTRVQLIRSHRTLQSLPARKIILFLGNSYNRFSLACFQALLELPHDVLLGVHDPLTPGLYRLTRRRLKVRGWDFVLRKAWDLTLAKTRIALRGIGVPFSKLATLAELCRTTKLKVVHLENPNNAKSVDQVRALGVDLIVVANFNLILKAPLLRVPRLGTINVHPSLLPKYRGPSPIYWVLANREKSTGVTIHYMDEGIDSGDIIEQRPIDIREGETQKTLWENSGSVASSLLREVIPRLLAGSASHVPQDHTCSSYYSWPPKGKFSV